MQEDSGVQTEKRKSRPVEDAFDDEVNLEDLHRNDYDEADDGYDYEEADPLPEKRKNQPAAAYDRDWNCRRRRAIKLIALGVALSFAFSIAAAVRTTVSTSAVSQNVREMASSMGQNIAHELTGSIVPGIISVIPFLVMLSVVLFAVRVMRRRFRD